MSAMSDELWRSSATELAATVRRRELSCVEVMQAHLARIEAVNPAVNAIVTLVPERALAEAAEPDARAARDEPLGLLHGLPVAIKDLMDTAGIRTTYGSPIHADHVPDGDALIVQRLRAAGAVVVGKTNTPEFGAGSHTFNEVFGATRNPYDLGRSAGGSSGGAAAALAAGMVPLADGSDLGGSVRNPASFCNVVGLRPSPGRIASTRPGTPGTRCRCLGPMARSVDDAALLLAAIAGPDPRAPLSLEADPAPFATLAPRELARHADRLERHRRRPADRPRGERGAGGRRAALEAMGCVVPTRARPDGGRPGLRGAARPGLRPGLRAGARDPRRPAEGDHPLEHAGRARADGCRRGPGHGLQTEMFERCARCSSATTRSRCRSARLRRSRRARVGHRDRGHRHGLLLEWMRSCSRIRITAHPALSLPGGFTRDGPARRLQLVGRHRGDLALLRLAAAVEQATGFGRRAPDL